MFEKRRRKIDNETSRGERKIIVFLLLTPRTALSIKSKSVALAYFPPDTTTELRSMDNGINRWSLKVRSRKRIVKSAKITRTGSFSNV